MTPAEIFALVSSLLIVGGLFTFGTLDIIRMRRRRRERDAMFARWQACGCAQCQDAMMIYLLTWDPES